MHVPGSEDEPQPQSETGATELLTRRLILLGLDPGYVGADDPPKFQDMLRRCANCPDWPRCERALGRGEGQSGLADYCRNGEAIDEMLIDASVRTQGS